MDHLPLLGRSGEGAPGRAVPIANVEAFVDAVSVYLATSACQEGAWPPTALSVVSFLVRLSQNRCFAVPVFYEHYGEKGLQKEASPSPDGNQAPSKRWGCKYVGSVLALNLMGLYVDFFTTSYIVNLYFQLMDWDRSSTFHLSSALKPANVVTWVAVIGNALLSFFGENAAAVDEFHEEKALSLYNDNHPGCLTYCRVIYGALMHAFIHGLSVATFILSVSSEVSAEVSSWAIVASSIFFGILTLLNFIPTLVFEGRCEALSGSCFTAFQRRGLFREQGKCMTLILWGVTASHALEGGLPFLVLPGPHRYFAVAAAVLLIGHFTWRTEAAETRAEYQRVLEAIPNTSAPEVAAAGHSSDTERAICCFSL